MNFGHTEMSLRQFIEQSKTHPDHRVRRELAALEELLEAGTEWRKQFRDPTFLNSKAWKVCDLVDRCNALGGGAECEEPAPPTPPDDANLLPCPHCGGTAVVMPGEAPTVVCQGCGLGYDRLGAACPIENQIKAWNKRVAPTPQGVVEALEELARIAKALRSGPVHTDYRGWCAGLAEDLDAALSALRAGPPTPPVECGPDCPMCRGEVCNLCGAGSWNNDLNRDCQHDVIDRHSEPAPTPPGVVEALEFYADYHNYCVSMKSPQKTGGQPILADHGEKALTALSALRAGPPGEGDRGQPVRDWRTIANNLAKAVGGKDRRIDELEAQLAERDEKIEELEVELRKRRFRRKEPDVAALIEAAVAWRRNIDRIHAVRKWYPDNRAANLYDATEPFLPPAPAPSRLELLEKAVEAFVSDFEGDFVLDGLIVDGPGERWGPLVGLYELAKAAHRAVEEAGDE